MPSVSVDAPPGAASPSGDWPAPRARQPVDAVVALPGSKSQTNRALVVAALAAGTSTLTGPLRSRDTELMAAGLRALGVDVAGGPAGSWLVSGTGRPLTPAADGPVAVDVGNAGTVARFLPPVAALATGSVRFDGDPRVRQRPLRPLVAALRQLGAEVAGDALPVTVHGHGRVPGGAVTVDASASSQLVSGLLLAAGRFDDGVRVEACGPPVPSTPHLAMTVEALRAAGVRVAVDDEAAPRRWSVTPGPYQPGQVGVEPDLSGAAAFLAAAAATGGRVVVTGWPDRTSQPGALLPALLEAMGASVRRDAAGLEITGPDRLAGLDVDLHDAGELAPVLAALACLAGGPSRLGGIAHLRTHETDRLAALARELSALGAGVEETADGLLITPARLTGGLFHTYDDHRLAMAAAVVGLVVDGVVVQDVATTAKTMPDFVQRWTAMLDPVQR